MTKLGRKAIERQLEGDDLLLSVRRVLRAAARRRAGRGQED